MTNPEKQKLERLAGAIENAWYARMFETDVCVGEEVYKLASEEDYAALGEDPTVLDVPLILKRESDGAFFEIELGVTATYTTSEGREAYREWIRKQAKKFYAPEKVDIVKDGSK